MDLLLFLAGYSKLSRFGQFTEREGGRGVAFLVARKLMGKTEQTEQDCPEGDETSGLFRLLKNQSVAYVMAQKIACLPQQQASRGARLLSGCVQPPAVPGAGLPAGSLSAPIITVSLSYGHAFFISLYIYVM